MLYPPKCLRAGSGGFAYVEVLTSLVLLLVLLVPALEALTTGVRGSAALAPERHIYLRGKLEAVLSKPFADLYAVASTTSTSTVNTALSDAAGAPNRRLVVLYRFSSASNALTSAASDLVAIKVYYEADGSATELALHTLAGKWW